MPIIINLKNENKIKEELRNAYIILNWEFLVKEEKERRLAQRLTQKELAMLAGVSTSTLARFEMGKTNIRISSVLKIFKPISNNKSELTHF